MAAMLHTSVLAPHLAPRITSGERYWRVWISLVKWWFTQQAFPRSAILTLIMSQACMSSALRFSPVVERGVADLSSEMPDTSLVKISAVLSRCFWFSSVPSVPGFGDGSFDFEPTERNGQRESLARRGNFTMHIIWVACLHAASDRGCGNQGTGTSSSG